MPIISNIIFGAFIDIFIHCLHQFCIHLFRFWQFWTTITRLPDTEEKNKRMLRQVPSL